MLPMSLDQPLTITDSFHVKKLGDSVLPCISLGSEVVICVTSDVRKIIHTLFISLLNDGLSGAL